MKELRLAGGMECEQSARRNAVTAVSYRQISGIQTKSIRLRLYHGTCFLSRDLLQIYVGLQ